MAEFNIRMGPDAAKSIDEYLEYRRIVGEDDGGQLFSPEEYDNYKKRVIPARLKNRLFVSWTSPNGMDCKLVGPETPCFCTHRYKQHKTDFDSLPAARPINLPCRVKGCKCKSYHFVPLNGSQPIRCRCKHYSDDHAEHGAYPCKKANCKCVAFRSSYTCTCGQPAYTHETVVETKEERLARGHPVGQDVPYAAMGGLTGFSSLAEAYMRLDDSGIGTPDVSALDAPIGASDHPLLRMHAPGLVRMGRATQQEVEAVTGGIQNFRLTGTDADMEYYEQRYQQRLKESRQRVQKPLEPPKSSASSRTKTDPGKRRSGLVKK